MSDIIKRIEKALKDMPLDSPSYASVLSLDKIDIYDALNELKTSQQTIKQQAERLERLEAVVNAADEVTAIIGCYGDIDSRNDATLKLLRLLNEVKPITALDKEK